MKKLIFWRLCWLLMNKLSFDERIAGATGYGGTSWPNTARMKAIWDANPWGGLEEFPLKLYRRMRKGRNDIYIINVYQARLAPTDPPYRSSGAVACDVAYGVLAAQEDKLEIRWWNQSGNAYVVGVRGEVANFWR